MTETTDLDKALEDLDEFKEQFENIFMAISPAHRVFKLPPLMNHIGRILVIAGETLQEQRTQELTLKWLAAYDKEITAIVDFAYGYIDVLKLFTRKCFKINDVMESEETVTQRLIQKTFGSKIKRTGVRIMGHIYDIQSLFTNKS